MYVQNTENVAGSAENYFFFCERTTFEARSPVAAGGPMQQGPIGIGHKASGQLIISGVEVTPQGSLQSCPQLGQAWAPQGRTT